MTKKRKILTVFLGISASLTLLGGTGRPSDGLLSFLLLLGFLVLLLGILSLADYIKLRVRKLLNEIGEDLF